MKKISVILLVWSMLFHGFGIFSSAEEMQTLTVSAEMKHETQEVSVTVQNIADYPQWVSFVIYKEGADLSKADEFVRIDETLLYEQEKVTKTFAMTEEDASGRYSLSVRGKGRAETVLFDYQSRTDVNQMILPEANRLTKDGVDAFFRKYSLLFQIIIDTSYEQAIDEAAEKWIVIRDKEYSKGFMSLEEIKRAYTYSMMLTELKRASSSEILNVLELYGTDIWEQLDNSDYTQHKEGFAALLYKRCHEDMPIGISSFTRFLDELLAVNLVNLSDAVSMSRVIETYAEQLGIDVARYCQYDSVSVNRALVGADFTRARDVAAALEKRMNELDRTKTSSGTSGGGGGGKGGLSLQVQIPSASLKPQNPQMETPFQDLDKAEWARESITALYVIGVVNGTDEMSFCPNQSITRAEFIKMVVTAFELYDENAQCEFNDAAKDSWCYPYLASAYENDIIYGRDDGTVGAADPISRQDVCVIADRVCRKKSIQLAGNRERKVFSDSMQIAGYATDSVAALQNAGIVDGFPSGDFQPLRPVTRAEAAKIIYGLLKI